MKAKMFSQTKKTKVLITYEAMSQTPDKVRQNRIFLKE